MVRMIRVTAGPTARSDPDTTLVDDASETSTVIQRKDRDVAATTRASDCSNTVPKNDTVRVQAGEIVHHHFSDPSADVHIVSKDGVVFAFHSYHLKKRSQYFRAAMTLPLAVFSPGETTSLGEPLGACARRVLLDFDAALIDLWLQSVAGGQVIGSCGFRGTGATLPVLYRFIDLLCDEQNRSVLHYALRCGLYGSLQELFQVAATYPDRERQLLAIAVARLSYQVRGSGEEGTVDFGSLQSLVYNLPYRYLAEFTIRSFFAPAQYKDQRDKGLSWVLDGDQQKAFIDAVLAKRADASDSATADETAAKKRKL